MGLAFLVGMVNILSVDNLSSRGITGVKEQDEGIKKAFGGGLVPNDYLYGPQPSKHPLGRPPFLKGV
jgi:hypothetical protein